MKKLNGSNEFKQILNEIDKFIRNDENSTEVNLKERTI